MANLTFRFLANDRGLKDGIARSKKQLNGFQGAAKTAGAGIAKAFAPTAILGGIAGLAAGLVKATKAASADLKSQKILAGQLRRTTKASDAQIASAESFVETISNQTGVLDDDLRPALANAVRGTGSLKKAQDLVSIALDGSVASGKPLNTVLQALIKASNGQTQSLYKLAPELRKTKGGLDEYAASVKGAAEQSADPFSKLNVVLENIEESLGSALLPLVEDFANFIIKDIAPAVQLLIADLKDPGTELGAFWVRAQEVFGKLFTAINKVIKSPLGKWILETFSSLALGALEQAAKAIEAVAAALNSLNTSIELYEILTGQKKAPKLGTSQNAIKSGQVLQDIKGFSFGSLDFAKLFEGFLGQERTKFAKGGIVLPRKGGTNAIIGEAGQAEAVIPLNRLDEFIGGGGGNTYVININKANVTGQEIVSAIQRYERGTGRKLLLNV